MPIIIKNISDHDGAKEPSEYTVQINCGPVLARFEHLRKDGLAECLRRAVEAVEAARAPGKVGH